MRIGYADPPYIGCAHLYKDHPDYGLRMGTGDREAGAQARPSHD